ncbi:hypothetical protein [Thiorhodococcus drewsii]|uniref:hypothetical protein n=1 Tax=Thiorhodococcus drewsii TaxID=210408 RepID=UPI0002DB8D2C
MVRRAAAQPSVARAAWFSVRVAAANASVAIVLGTLAANALVRQGRIRARAGCELLLAAPLVIPDVIIGLSLLLLFVAMQHTIGWPDGADSPPSPSAPSMSQSSYARDPPRLTDP